MTDLDQLLPGAERARAFPEPESPAPPPLSFTRYQPPPLKELPAEFGTRQRIIRMLTLGLHTPQPSPVERAYRTDRETIRTATWDRSQRVMVASPKGCSFKTPAALILAGALAAERGGGVAVWDACDAAGTLAARAGGVQHVCVSEIAAHPQRYPDPPSLGRCAATQSSLADVFGSLREREFGAADVLTVSGVLNNSYRITVADTANTPHSGAYQALLAAADILLVPVVLTADSINKALTLLQHTAKSALARNAVVVISNYGGPATAAEARAVFTAAGVGAVLDVPFDAHIASGGEIELSRLSHTSRLAWTRVGATVVKHLEGVE